MEANSSGLLPINEMSATRAAKGKGRLSSVRKPEEVTESNGLLSFLAQLEATGARSHQVDSDADSEPATGVGRHDDNVCCICLEPIHPRSSRVDLLPCLHYFCRPCIEQWVLSLQAKKRATGDSLQEGTCPLCKTAFQDGVVTVESHGLQDNEPPVRMTWKLPTRIDIGRRASPYATPFRPRRSPWPSSDGARAGSPSDRGAAGPARVPAHVISAVALARRWYVYRRGLRAAHVGAPEQSLSSHMTALENASSSSSSVGLQAGPAACRGPGQVGWKTAADAISPAQWLRKPTAMRQRLVPWIVRELTVIENLVLHQLDERVAHVIGALAVEERQQRRRRVNVSSEGPGHSSRPDEGQRALSHDSSEELAENTDEIPPELRWQVHAAPRLSSKSGDCVLREPMVLEFVLAVLQKHHPQSVAAVEALRGFLHEHAEQFVHELVAFARSPWRMTTYDAQVVYPGLPTFDEMVRLVQLHDRRPGMGSTGPETAGPGRSG